MPKDTATTVTGAVQRPVPGRGAWIAVLRRYILFIALANLAWEAVQLPLYTIWTEGTFGEMAFAVVHCTGGDVLIGGFSVLAALLCFGNSRWPAERYGVVAAAAIATAVAVTIYSEWRNVDVLGNWAYSERMPTLPVIGTGLSPLAQWIVIPVAAFWWSRRARSVRSGDT
jgi:hypothetical protein